jgi:hypothetical protein
MNWEPAMNLRRLLPRKVSNQQSASYGQAALYEPSTCCIQSNCFNDVSAVNCLPLTSLLNCLPLTSLLNCLPLTSLRPAWNWLAVMTWPVMKCLSVKICRLKNFFLLWTVFLLWTGCLWWQSACYSRLGAEPMTVLNCLPVIISLAVIGLTAYYELTSGYILSVFDEKKAEIFFQMILFYWLYICTYLLWTDG